MPFLMAALVFLPLLLSMINDSDRETVVLVDNTGEYAKAFKSDDRYLFVVSDQMKPSYRSDSTEVDAVVQITADLVDFPNSAVIYSQKEVPLALKELVNNTLSEEVRKEKLRRYSIPELDKIISDVETDVDVATVRWTDEGERESISEIAMACGMVLTFLIYMFVLSYGSMVMQGVVEEKTNRIVELMVSSVRPIDLLLGKIIGVGLVGILQMLIWGLLLMLIVGGVSVAAGIPFMDEASMSQMNAMAASGAVDSDIAEIMSVISALPIFEMVSLFVLYFIGGYLLYASILAAMGSAINDQQDSQQLMMPVLFIMMFAFYAGFYSAQNPEGPFAFWMSFVPFTSPIVMMVRIPFGIPFYQELISLVVLFGSAFVILWLSAKIYRVGILMYGKKVSFKELYKWLKYK